MAVAALAIPARVQAAPTPLPTAAAIHDTFIAIGPVAAAVYAPGGWRGAFGGEILFGRMDESSVVTVAAVTLGAADLSNGDRGRMWAEGVLGTRRVLGITGGVSAGLAVEFHPVEPPDLGAHASLWVYAGVVPYIGVARIAGATSIDFGIRLPLPAKTW